MSFNGISLTNSMKSNLKRMGINDLFTVQKESYKPISSGSDIVIHSKTGSGKTLAFGIPLMERVVSGDGVQLLALAPTRELAKQISEQLEQLSNARVIPVYGGVGIHDQVRDLKKGVDVVIGTPGRVIDLIGRRALIFTKLRFMVVDEVDKMMDMGFKDSVEEIINKAFNSVTSKPQLVLLSATMPEWVYSVTKTYMRDHKLIKTVTTNSKTPSSVRHVAVNVEYWGLIPSINHLVLGLSSGRTIIFVDTKQMISDIANDPELEFSVDVLHGDIEQSRREHVLNAFRDGYVKVLLCTDVASRGIDIPDVELVLQCNPPRDPDNYIHRAGRTGRAGKEGLSICLYNNVNCYDERLLMQIEKKACFLFDSTPSVSDAVLSQIREKVKSVEVNAVENYVEAASILLSSDSSREVVAAMMSLLFAERSGREIANLNDTFKQDFTFNRKQSYKNEIFSRGSAYRRDNTGKSLSYKQNYFNDRKFFNKNDSYDERRMSYKQDFRRSRDDFFGKGGKDLKWERGSKFS